MDESFSLNFNSVVNVPCYEARTAFTVNSSAVFKEDVDIVPTIIDERNRYVNLHMTLQHSYSTLTRDKHIVTKVQLFLGNMKIFL